MKCIALQRRLIMQVCAHGLCGLACLCLLAASVPLHAAETAAGSLRAGAAELDISPTDFPVIVSGGFLEKTATKLQAPLFARALVLDDGKTRLCLTVVDTLFVPRDLVDEVKQAVSGSVGIPPEHIMISAIHTHSAPSLAGALGTGVDEPYRKRLPGLLLQVIRQAAAKLQPARAGAASVSDPDHTHCRRWIRRPDRIGKDPFGDMTIRAMMHPGYQNPDYIGPAGAVDTGLSLVSVVGLDGRPLAVLANYSMHYFGAAPVSPDYFGLFCRELAEKITPPGGKPPVVMLSQGTAGDLHWMDYSQPRKAITIERYAHEVAETALKAYGQIRYQESSPLAMAETRLTLKRRVPDAKRLDWAKAILAEMGDRTPKNQPEIYAREQIYLHNEPQRELKLQAVRIGQIGITAIPCEVFGITGLKLKAQSPLPLTFNIELANGCDGYIPPPEQHALGGYTTWPARSAGLEVQAEPKIVEAVLQLLEKVAQRKRHAPAAAGEAYANAVLAARPAAYWRLNEMAGAQAADCSGHNSAAQYKAPFALYLEGPQPINRAVHLAGGYVHADVPQLGSQYSLEFWFWNGLPADARPVTGYLASRGAGGKSSDLLGIGGSGGDPGKLFFAAADGAARLVGHTTIPPKTWNHVLLVRSGGDVHAYLNGNTAPELSGPAAPCAASATLLLGSDADQTATFEGKLAETAVYARALNAAEAAKHFAAANK